jgi:two-component system, chemotaxis family, protein-glutamate methylesterase/glutaminase
MPYELIAVGTSWGGLAALGRLLDHVPETLDLPIVIAQHRGPESVRGALESSLQRRVRRRVREVEDKDPIEPGHVYLAPPDYHLLVEHGSFALSLEGRVRHARPSIDVLFESAADTYGAGVIGIVLTGANDDGAAGLARIEERGGLAIVQDPETAEAREMPEAAIAAASAPTILALDRIGPYVAELMSVEAVSRGLVNDHPPDRSFQTDARAEPVRPDAGTASGAL